MRAEPPEHLPPLMPTAPSRTPPPGGVDSHAHVFGPLDRFPVGEGASYEVFDLPAERYLEQLDAVGLAGGVLVTPSAYGTDNRALTHALATQPERLRGIAVVDDRPSRRSWPRSATREFGACASRSSPSAWRSSTAQSATER
jgi:2-pyrone-4,6-dicarboxylate lactonase